MVTMETSEAGAMTAAGGPWFPSTAVTHATSCAHTESETSNTWVHPGAQVTETDPKVSM